MRSEERPTIKDFKKKMIGNAKKTKKTKKDMQFIDESMLKLKI